MPLQQNRATKPRRRGLVSSAIVLSALAYIAAIASWIAYDTLAGRAARYEAALPTVAARPLGTNAMLYAVAGADSTGNRAAFEIIVARAPVQWAAGSADRLAHGDAIVPGRALGGLATEEVRARLSGARRLIALGIAAEEGTATETLYLAAQRARQTAIWLAALVPSGAGIDMLTLGRATQPCRACDSRAVSWQRPIAIAAVVDSAPGTDLAEALAAALASARNLPSPARFTSFALTRHR